MKKQKSVSAKKHLMHNDFAFLDKDLNSLSSFSSSEKLREKGIYYITGSIEQDSLLEIHQDILLKHLDPSWKDDIQLIVNCLGGEIPEGWAFIDLLKFIRMDVRTVGMGECCSLGAMLVACGTNGKRIAAQNLSLMVHGASSFNFINGNKQQIIAQMKWVEHEHERDINFWIQHSKHKTRKQIEKYFLNGSDQYFTAEQALNHGIVDFIQMTSKDNVEK